MKRRSIVLYCSKTGFTEQYARWIAGELACKAVPFRERNRLSLDEYDTIVFGGGLCAGKIRGLSWLKGRLPLPAGKRLCVFAVGAAPAGTPNAVAALEQALTGTEWEGAASFYFQGGIRYERMSPLDRLLMSAICAMLKKQEGPESEAYRMLSGSFDAADRQAVKPLIDWANS